MVQEMVREMAPKIIRDRVEGKNLFKSDLGDGELTNQYPAQEILWEIPLEVLQEILQEILWGNSAGNTVGNSVGNAVENAAGSSVRNSMGNSMGNAVGNSMGNASGNFKTIFEANFQNMQVILIYLIFTRKGEIFIPEANSQTPYRHYNIIWWVMYVKISYELASGMCF